MSFSNRQPSPAPNPWGEFTAEQRALCTKLVRSLDDLLREHTDSTHLAVAALLNCAALHVSLAKREDRTWEQLERNVCEEMALWLKSVRQAIEQRRPSA